MIGWTRKLTSAAILAAIALGVVPSASARQASPAAEARNERLNRIVDDFEALRAGIDPDVEARRLGKAPARWANVTREARQKEGREKQALLRRLQALGPLGDDDALDRDVLVSLLREDIADITHDLDRIPFTGDWGFHMLPVFVAPSMRLTSVERAEAWIARVNDVPRYFGEHIANMRRGISTGFTAHPDPLGTTIDQISEQAAMRVTESPLYRPLLVLPDTIPPEEQARLRAEGEAAVANAIEAYRTLLDFLEYEYRPAARSGTGLISLPNGKAAYADLVRTYTTRDDLTPDEVHRIGLRRVAEIRLEMEAVIEEIGFEGDFQDFLTLLRTDRQFYARSPAILISRAEAISEELRQMLPNYFGRLPRTAFIVEPVPATIAPGFTTARYLQGDASEARPGTYLVNTFRLDQRPLYELPALSAHEAVPGHHLQIMLAQELVGVREFRRSYGATAFVEGWALYAEKLAGEGGLYKTPYEEFGALSYQMWRACRLVADTGIHWYGWTREEAEQCFLENSALAPLNIKTEVTRYIGWPGQATAYAIGEMTISDLRAEAEMRLGPDFDIRDFHDTLLGAGAMPLDVLERRMRAWMDGVADSSEARAP